MTNIRILHLEDNDFDAELIATRLAVELNPISIRRVISREEYLEALRASEFDLILSDYTIPSYDGITALYAARKHCPDTPFIFVSGTIGEERAIDAIKEGATDYVIKDNPSRLVLAIRSAYRESQERRQRRAAETLVRDQAALLDQAHEAIFVLDREKQVIYWNMGATRLYGWSADQVCGWRPDEFMALENHQEFEGRWTQVMERGAWSGQIPQITKTGETVIVESRWTLVRNDAGEPKSVFVIDADVTERRQIETQLLRLQRMESIGQLAGGIAHDLNNILSPVLMGAQTLGMRLRDPGDLEIVRSIVSSATRGAELVRQVLTFARGGTGHQAPVKIDDLINELAKFAKNTFTKTIKIETTVPPDLSQVMADGIQLYQVLLNLCINARDAMPTGGRLTLRAENCREKSDHGNTGPTEDFVAVTVEDTGVGIPLEIQESIFEPFFTTKSAGYGTGLGLSTCKQIVESHGGFLRVDSRPGHGSRFTFYLPTEKSPEPQDTNPFLSVPRKKAGLLLIDDDMLVLQVLRARLEAEGYEVFHAVSGPEALQIIEKKESQIDAVLCDMIMPTMDGATTVRVLKRKRPNLICIGMSGLMTPSPSADSWDPAFDGLLAKPFLPQEMLSTISELLGKRRASLSM